MGSAAKTVAKSARHNVTHIDGAQSRLSANTARGSWSRPVGRGSKF